MEAESSLLGLILAVFMEYEEETWRLPRPHVSSKLVMPTSLTDHATLNIFPTLAEYQVPDKPMGTVRQSERGDEDQRKFAGSSRGCHRLCQATHSRCYVGS